MDEKMTEQWPACYHDNRLCQLGAWLLHPAAENDKPEPEQCLEWLLEQSGDDWRACMFQAVLVPVDESEQWFLLGWLEFSPPTVPRYIEQLDKSGVEPETIEYLQAGNKIRVQAACWGSGLLEISVV